MEGRARTGSDWRYAHVGLLAWDFFMVSCHLDPQRHVRLWHDAQGRLVGYALLGEDPLLDWQVLPEHQWQGLEEEALAWAEGLLAELRDEDPGRWSAALGAGARKDDGTYPEGTVHGLVDRELARLAKAVKDAAAEEKDDKKH